MYHAQMHKNFKVFKLLCCSSMATTSTPTAPHTESPALSFCVLQGDFIAAEADDGWEGRAL